MVRVPGLQDRLAEKKPMIDTPSQQDSDLEALVKALRRFTAERGWQRFHSPKNLAMALGGEAGELLEQLQWLSESESADPDPDRREAIQHEIADVFIYTIMLSDRLGIDLIRAAFEKIALNERKYPAATSGGGPDEHRPRGSAANE